MLTEKQNEVRQSPWQTEVQVVAVVVGGRGHLCRPSTVKWVWVWGGVVRLQIKGQRWERVKAKMQDRRARVSTGGGQGCGGEVRGVASSTGGWVG